MVSRNQYFCTKLGQFIDGPDYLQVVGSLANQGWSVITILNHEPQVFHDQNISREQASEGQKVSLWDGRQFMPVRGAEAHVKGEQMEFRPFRLRGLIVQPRSRRPINAQSAAWYSTK